MLLAQQIVLLDARGQVGLEREALGAVGLGLALALPRLILQVRRVLPHRDDLLGERVEATLVGRSVLTRTLHQLLVVHDKILDL